MLLHNSISELWYLKIEVQMLVLPPISGKTLAKLCNPSLFP